MRYSTEPKYRKYVKGYIFSHLPENLVISMVKIDAAKTASKRVVQKTALEIN